MFNPEHSDVRELAQRPIPEATEDVLAGFRDKRWKAIPISESVTEEPKHLEVIPNIQQVGKAMAWPAYYKTVASGRENDGQAKGFGELAQAIGGDVQISPLVKLRANVKAQLDKAQAMLDANADTRDFQIVVVDGYRTVGVQRRLFDAYHAYVRETNPGVADEQSRDMARKMVSEPPADLDLLRKSPPPHTTGGAIDIVLAHKSKIDVSSDYWLSGAMVSFGADFDEMMHPVHGDERSSATFYEQKLTMDGQLNEADQRALENRRILYHVLTSVGITNYPHEFWHFDSGNQFHAIASGKESAEYGFAGGIDNGNITEDLTAERAAFDAYVASHGAIEAGKVRGHFGL